MEDREKKNKKQRPIKIRENPFAKSNKKWWEFWKKEKGYGISITLTPEQVEEAKNLKDSGEPITIKILEENYKHIPEPETIEPLLVLMKENGYADVLENVKSGEFIISTPKGEKSIWLTPEKLQTLKIRDKYYRCWIAYENCMTPYPEEPIYSSELQRRIIQKVAINYRDVNEAKIITAKTKMWLYIIAAIVIGLVLLFSTDLGAQLIQNLQGGGVEAVKEAGKQVIENNSIVNNSGVGMK